MYDRLTQGGKITLFSPSDVPGLYDAFFADQAEFERLYLRYEQDTTIRHKKVVEAKDLFTSLMQERAQTGRIYIQNVDHCNTHSAFNPAVAPIKQSNLCMEITLPTKPLQNIDDPNGEIALCTLAAFNLGSFEQLDELESLADLLVRALDSLLDYQNYPVNAALHNRQRRTLGVGVTNFAYYLAKHGVYYSNGSANRLTHRLFEAFQYYLLKASNQLAKELGKCNLFEETKYAQGILPIDTYKREVDKVCPEPLHYDWEALRADIQRYGLRNSTLSALMPCETSSQITNSTNGIEPPRGLMSVKSSKDGTPKQIVPGFTQYGGNYELLWSIPDNKGYLELVGIMQKFVDQSISANTNYDPARYPNKKVPVTRLLQDLLYAHAMGVKTLYYHQTRDGSGQQDEDDCAGGACKL
jgi:ribonucleoside-diphosphate reductase alpha chain